MSWVYILQSSKNKSYYIGSTENIERRLLEHNSGKTKSLKHLLPVSLVFKEVAASPAEARKLELKLKKYKNRAILEKIINDGYIMGHELIW